MGRRIDAAMHAAWRRRWERFEGSSVTVAEFCRREGVSSATFYQWRKRLARGATAAEEATTRGSAAATRREAGQPGGPAAFVELTLTPAAIVELELPNGVRVRVPADREAALGAAIRAAGELARSIGTQTREASSC